MRLMVAASCSGFSATTICAVEQLGLAMMFFLVKPRERVAVHLRHDQRHVLVVAPARRVIDHDAALGGDLAAQFLGGTRTRRHQADIDSREVEMLEVLALENTVAVADLGADRAARGEGEDLVGGEFAVGQHVHHLAPDIARGADDCNFVAHLSSILLARAPRAAARRILLRAVRYALFAESFKRDTEGTRAWRLISRRETAQQRIEQGHPGDRRQRDEAMAMRRNVCGCGQRKDRRAQVHRPARSRARRPPPARTPWPATGPSASEDRQRQPHQKREVDDQVGPHPAVIDRRR